MRESLRLFSKLTDGTMDFSLLEGEERVASRRSVMQTLRGAPVARKQFTIAAMRAKFYTIARINPDLPPNESQEKFRQWVYTQIGETTCSLPVRRFEIYSTEGYKPREEEVAIGRFEMIGSTFPLNDSFMLWLRQNRSDHAEWVLQEQPDALPYLENEKKGVMIYLWEIPSTRTLSA